MPLFHSFSPLFPPEDWFPYSGTLIALLRHGLRSGHLDAVRDVVDHDVDVLVGVTSAEVGEVREVREGPSHVWMLSLVGSEGF